jgi:hypothetical protein
MITLQRSHREIEPVLVGTAPAVERIELGKRVCDALETENVTAKVVGGGGRLSATLAAYAAICQRADYAHRRAAVAHFARQLRQS